LSLVGLSKALSQGTATLRPAPLQDRSDHEWDIVDMYSLKELELALNRGEFFLEYLPTIALVENRCVGAEALIRWQRGTDVVYPLDFIPTAEGTWLAGQITYWVIETVAAELHSWLLNHDGVRISINVPPEIFGRGGLIYAARKSKLTDVGDKIQIEVTERGLLDCLGVCAINTALENGYHFALDDIGTDDASLLVLSRVSAGTVKLDKAFADQMLQPDWHSDKIASIAALIKNGNLRVIAEGVECARQVEILAEAGVQMAQGFYFARPMRAPQFTAYFDHFNGLLP
jgi:sensor c-di-GMP phosphodiesterase-like protein